MLLLRTKKTSTMSLMILFSVGVNSLVGVGRLFVVWIQSLQKRHRETGILCQDQLLQASDPSMDLT